MMKLRSVRGVWRDFRSPLYRNAIFLMAVSPVNQIFGFLFWFVVVRVYHSADVGLAAAAITTLGLLAGIATLSLDVGLVRFLPEAGDNAGAMLNSCLTISALGGLVAAGVFMLGAPWWAPSMIFLSSSPMFAISFLAASAAMAMFIIIKAGFLARRRTHFTLWLAVVQGFKIPLPFVLAAFFGVFGIFGSWTLALLVSTTVGLFWLLPRALPKYRPRPRVKLPIVKHLFHLSMANYLTNIVGGLAGGVIPLLILNALGPESVAHYYVASTMVALINNIPAAVMDSLFAEGSQPAANFSRDVRRAAVLIIPLVGAGILAFYFFGNILLGLFGREYSDAALRLIQLLALSTGLSVISGLYGTKLLIEKRIRWIIGFSITGTAMSLGTAIALLPLLGLTGIGVAFVATSGIMAVIVAFLWWRTSKGE